MDSVSYGNYVKANCATLRIPLTDINDLVQQPLWPAKKVFFVNFYP